MKLRFIKRDDAGAVVMTTALCIFAVSTLLVVGYLWLVMGQGRLVSESQNWNRALTVAEAGVEEAMAQLNWGPTAGRSDLSANGWGAVASSTGGVNIYGPPGVRTLTGMIGDSYCASFTAPVSPILTNGASATIYSTGLVTVAIRGATVARRVEVTAKMEPRFPDAIDVVSNFTANGGGSTSTTMSTDSWNSQTNTLSTNGQYDSSKVSTNGGVGAEFGTVDLSKHTIKGNLYLGANADYVSPPIQVTGTIYNDYNVQIPDAQLPGGNWQDATKTKVFSFATNIIGGFPVIVTNILATQGYNFTNSGNYRITKAGGAYPIFIAPGVTVNLDVELTTFDTTSSSAVTIEGGINNAGTVNIYQESGSAILGLAAGTYRPANFEYYGLPGVNGVTMSFSGNSSFIGVIYAPEANLKLNGGGSGVNDISGALVAHTFTMGGHFGVHFDESLLLYGPSKGFVATSWREF